MCTASHNKGSSIRLVSEKFHPRYNHTNNDLYFTCITCILCTVSLMLKTNNRFFSFFFHRNRLWAWVTKCGINASLTGQLRTDSISPHLTLTPFLNFLHAYSSDSPVNYLVSLWCDLIWLQFMARQNLKTTQVGSVKSGSHVCIH